MTALRILVTGSRDWADKEKLFNVLSRLWDGEPMTVVHGACPSGADAIADVWAVTHLASEVTAERHPADWSLGQQAGPLRNQLMVDLGADLCVAFPLPGSSGTYDCMRRAAAAGIQVINYGNN